MTFARPKPYTRPPSLVPKPSTGNMDPKGPERSAAHLAMVRTLPCLCCPHGRQESPTRAHHPKGLFPRTAGKRISDLLCLPLCDRHHTDGPDALHATGDELGWWKRMGVEPYGAILSSLAGSRHPDKEEAMQAVKMERAKEVA